jgi:arylsulfatase A-like enzyme
LTRVVLILLAAGCGAADSGPNAADAPIAIQPVPDRTLVGEPAPLLTDTMPRFLGSVPRNLLVISVDTFRKDHLTRFGGPQITPFLDGIAAEGLSLEDHIQCSNWTYASTTCTLLGRSNIDNGFLPALTGDRLPVPDGTSFLATYLADAGFYNILVSGNSWLSDRWNNHQGYHDAAPTPTQRANAIFEDGKGRLDRAIADGKADRWFLHLHLMEPHASYSPPPEYRDGLADLEPLPFDLDSFDEHYEATAWWPALTMEEQELMRQHMMVRYQGEISWLDDQIAWMFDELEAAGLLEDTLVLIWNDHGEAFWEHEVATHAYTLHAEENDAFALFWSKNIAPMAWDGPTSSIDLTPTLLRLFDIPAGAELTGIPVGQGSPDRARFAMSVARLGVVQSVVQDNVKMQFHWASGHVVVHDRKVDPKETLDLYDPEDAVVQQLWSVLRPQIERAQPLSPSHTVLWPEDLP